MNEKEKKKISPANVLRNNIYMLKLIWEVSPGSVILRFISDLLGFASWVFFSVIFMKYLFGAAEIQRSFQETALFVIISTAVMLLITIFDGYVNQKFMVINEHRIYYHLNKKLFEKAINVDISCYENPDFYDNYTKANTEVFARATSVLNNFGVVISSLLSSVYVIFTMFSINIYAGLFTFLPLIGNLYFGKISNKYMYDRNMENVPNKRRQDYVNRTVYLQKFAKEIRLTNIFSVLRNTYNTSYEGTIKVNEKYWKRIFSIESIKSIICFPLVFEGLWLFAAFCAMVTKTILVGDFVVLASAIVSTTWMLISFSGSVVETYNNGRYISNLKTFLSYKPAINEDQLGLDAPQKVEILELKNVSFKYEGKEDYVLKNINIKINSGQIISLVGHNGAGKSTLVKLIMRLYDPTEGEILLNGINIKEFHLAKYRNLIGSTFQDFQLFSLSVLENVMMSKIENEEQRQIALEALKQSGIDKKIDTLPKKSETTLTKEFDDDGINLSGGEGQKLAVSRAFAKNSPIVILDEPSSALDPIAEYDMYETIMDLCSKTINGNKRLSIIISHRLSSAAMADYIYLLNEGTVLEHGKHSELMDFNGMYAEMFTKQAENYLIDKL